MSQPTQLTGVASKSAVRLIAVTSANDDQIKILYSERQWIAWYWWVMAFIVVAILTAQFAMNRSVFWLYIPAAVLSLITIWGLVSLSKTTIRVEEDADGMRWLVCGQANLPNTVVDRVLVVPASAKQSAMGRQLDPAAYLVSHSWVKEMVMIVLNDPNDPTPYWLMSSKNPEALLKAFTPDLIAKTASAD